MLMTLVLSGALSAAAIAGLPDGGVPSGPAAVQAAADATAAQVAPFAGEWALVLEGPNGPGNFALSIRTEKDKPAADISADVMPKQPISTFAMAEKSLMLGYSFLWEGNSVDAAVTLTPAADGTTKARIDFAGGAYVMEGTATRKDPTK